MTVISWILLYNSNAVAASQKFSQSAKKRVGYDGARSKYSFCVEKRLGTKEMVSKTFLRFSLYFTAVYRQNQEY